MVRFSDIPIRPKLITLFLLTGVIPLAIVGFYGNRLAMNALMQKSFDQLITTQSIRKGELERIFRERATAFRTLSESRDVKDLVKTLFDYYGHDDKHADETVSITGELILRQIENTYGPSLRSFMFNHSCHDLMILDAEHGHILYSASGSKKQWSDLSNVNTHGNGLAKTWKKVLETTQPVIVDFNRYSPSGNIQSAFYGYPLTDVHENIMGVFIVQISPAFVNEIMRSRQGMGETGESYLISMNEETGLFELRSALQSMGDGKYVVGYVHGTNLSYWEEAEKYGEKGNYGTYVDSKGNAVLTAYNKLNIDGLEWYLVSKIDKYEVDELIRQLFKKTLIISGSLLILIGIGGWLLARSISRPIIEDVNFAKAITLGKLDQTLSLDQRDELGQLAKALNHMAKNLRENDWLKQGKDALNSEIRGERKTKELARRFISFVVKHMDAQLGAFYIVDNGRLMLHASYAFTDRKGNFNTLEFGEGMVGQAALEREMIFFRDLSEDAPVINYGAGEQKASHYAIVPLTFEGETLGVVLIGSTSYFTALHKKFLEQTIKNTAVILNTAGSAQRIHELLERTREQQKELVVKNEELEEQTRALKESEAELQSQQEELRVTNEELEEQTGALKESEAELQAQQEELRVTNEELEEQTKALEFQQNDIQKRNDELTRTQKALSKKAFDLETASKYKSEFLANMSHELRTPLNSILILSQLLAANKKGNLTGKQVESAGAIHSSGYDLLTLINDILDLSKVEAGKVDIIHETVALDALIKDLDRIFKGMSEQKGVPLEVMLAPDLPDTMISDSQRLQQILRNLLTNAFKFTSKGTISLTICRPSSEMLSGVEFGEEGLLAFEVKDDGIGIPEEKQAVIFEAFQQADGSTSRNYGGTGLGLSISRELARLLGGVIHLNSVEGKGSTFTLILPEKHTAFTDKPSMPQQTTEPGRTISGEPAIPQADGKADRTVSEKASSIPRDNIVNTLPEFVEDDRKKIQGDDKSVLIIEDDQNFATILRDFAREKGFSCIIAEDGETGLHFADFYRPSAVILDIGLPGIDGWAVMERLKENRDLRHIPVHFISAEDSSMDAMRMGAVGFLTKPVSVESIDRAFGKIENIITRPIRNLLVVEDDALQRESIRQLIGNGDVKTTLASTGKEAYKLLVNKTFDCMILDLGLHDMSGFELLEEIRKDEACSHVPVIVYTGRELSREEENKLRVYTESIIIKGAKSPERLLEESALFLHRVEAKLPREKQEMLKMIHDREPVLNNKNILIVDDDMRNVFALSSALEEKQMNVVVARNGLEGIEKLEQTPDIDAVLMDIMMPKMDGYEAMSNIRQNSKFKKLPIIALTAKAMKGDRNKCMEAGASDYLAKPVDTDKLVSMLRVWLYK